MLSSSHNSISTFFVLTWSFLRDTFLKTSLNLSPFSSMMQNCLQASSSCTHWTLALLLTLLWIWNIYPPNKLSISTLIKFIPTFPRNIHISHAIWEPFIIPSFQCKTHLGFRRSFCLQLKALRLFSSLREHILQFHGDNWDNWAHLGVDHLLPYIPFLDPVDLSLEIYMFHEKVDKYNISITFTDRRSVPVSPSFSPWKMAVSGTAWITFFFKCIFSCMSNQYYNTILFNVFVFVIKQ